MRQLWMFLLTFLALPVLANAQTEIMLGDKRPAPLLLPEAPPATGIALVVFLHGYTSNGRESGEYLGLLAAQKSRSFALLLPDGTRNSEGNRFWNATPECCDFEGSGVDDAGYLAGLIQEALERAPIDPERIYFFGHSNGGFMSYRMACEYPELVTGLVSIAGAFFTNAALCRNPGNPNVLQIHGRLDEVIPFAPTERLIGARQSVAYWAKRQGCQPPREFFASRDLVHEMFPEGDETTKETDELLWDDCSTNQRFALWALNGVGHVPYFKSGWIAAALNFLADDKAGNRSLQK
jgi:polyhydroxybutyrate depolymerase